MIIELRKQGHTYKEISEVFETTEQAIHYLGKKADREFGTKLFTHQHKAKGIVKCQICQKEKVVLNPDKVKFCSWACYLRHHRKYKTPKEARLAIKERANFRYKNDKDYKLKVLEKSRLYWRTLKDDPIRYKEHRQNKKDYYHRVTKKTK